MCSSAVAPRSTRFPILSARNILAALDPELFDPVPIAITRDGRWILQSTERLLREKGDPRDVRIDLAGKEIVLFDGRIDASHASRAALDVIFPIVHGPMGEDGTLQGLLEIAGSLMSVRACWAQRSVWTRM